MVQNLIHWFRDLSIARKLAAGAVVSLSALMIVGAVAIVRMQHIVSEVRGISNNWLPSINVLSAMCNDLMVMRAKEYKYLLEPKPMATLDIEAEMDVEWQKYHNHEQTYILMITLPDEQQLYQRIQTRVTEYFAVQQEFRALVRNGQLYEAKRLLFGRSLKSFSSMRDLFDQDVEFNVTAARQALAKSETMFARFFWIVSLGMGMSIVMVGGLSLWIAREIIPPLKRLNDAAGEVSMGNQMQFVEVAARDEIGSLTLAFNTMVRTLRSNIAQRENNLDWLESVNTQLADEIQQRQHIEGELIAAKHEADSANRLKSEFLANMSHEIRTPMNAILGFAHLLGEQSKDPKLLFYVEAISSSSKTLLNIINDILDLSKIEAGRLTIEYSAVNPRTIFREVENIFRLKAQEKNIALHIDIANDLPTGLVLDEVRLRQVLLNLMSNAVKFTETGYVKLLARHSFSEHDRSLLDLIIRVEDTGIGIPFEKQATIFEPFRQQEGQSTKKYGGTGLGLAISKRLVTVMNGDLLLESVYGSGSVFTVVLRDVVTASVAVEEPEQGRVEDVRFIPATILVVDDIQLNRDLVKGYLNRYPFTFLEAENGQQAIEQAQEHLPDLILMDLKMPVMDGYSATPILKNTPATARIPVLALTASAMKDDNEKTMAVGFDGVLYKPVSRTVLLKELLRFLSHTFDTTIASDTVLTENTLQSSIGSASRGAEALQHSHHPSFMNGRSVLSEEVCVRLPELLAILEGEYGKQWQSVRNSLVMKKIEKFASGVVSLSEEYHVPELKEFGELLLRHKQYYELDAIPTTMERFPGIVEQIREHIRHHRDQV